MAKEVAKTGQKSVVTTLGDGQVFVVRDERGLVRCVQANIRLSKSKGDLTTIQGKTSVSVQGYNKLNQIPGVSVITPPTVVIDGVEQPNPYIERQKITKAVRSVIVRKIALGLTPIGNWQAIDCTTFFNVYTYFLQDVQAKLKRFPAAGALGIKSSKPPLFKWEKTKWQNNKFVRTGQFEEIAVKDHPLHFLEIEQGVGLWIDLSHSEIDAAYREHVARQKFGDRIAQSICTRNALKAHAAIATMAVTLEKDNDTAIVPVYGFRHSLTDKQLSGMADKVSKGEIKTGEVEVKATVEEASFDEVATVQKGEADEFGAVPEEEKPSEPESAPEKDEKPEEEKSLDQQEAEEKRAIMAELTKEAQRLGSKKFSALLKERMKVKSVSDLNLDGLNEFLSILGEEK